MDKQSLHISAAIVLASMLGACGGGGGSGGGGGVTPPPPPPPISANTPLPLTSSNAESVARSGVTLVENSIQIFIAAMQLVEELINNDALTFQLNCGAGGTATAAVNDTDANLRISAGDTIDVDFAACFEEPSIQEISGTISLTLTEFTDVDVEPLLIRGRISTPSPITNLQTVGVPGGALTEVLDGQFDFAWSIYEFVDSLALSQVAGTQFTSTISNQTDVIRNLFLARDGGGSLRSSFEADIESERQGGAYRCATSDDLISRDSGALRCSGASGSEIRLITRNTGTFVDLSVDAEGDGTFVGVAVDTGRNEEPSINDFSDATLTSTRTPKPFLETRPLPVAVNRELVLDINGGIVDPTSSRIYVTTDTGVSVIDLDTLAVVESVVFNPEPGAIAISDDGSTLWVGFNFAAEVLPIDAATLTPGAPVSIAVVSDPSSSDRGAIDIEVAPGTTDTLVIGDIGGKEMYAVADGNVLPDVISDKFAAPRNVVFTSPTELLGFNGNVGFQLELTANGVNLVKEVDGFGEGISGGLAQHPVIVDALAFNRAGQAFDFENDSIEGRIRFDGAGIVTTTRSGGVFNAGTNLLYYVGATGTDTVEIYTPANLRAVGRYALNTGFTAVYNLALASDGSLIILATDRIVVVDVSELSPNISDEPCVTRDYSSVRESGAFYEIECRFEDLVYDNTRDLIYASIPGYERNGNTIAVIDPDNGSIVETIPIGSEPGRMSLSADSSLLWVALTEASRAVAVNLDSRSIETTVRFSLEPAVFFDAGAPLLPHRIAVSPASNNDVVVAFRFSDEVRLYANGLPAMSTLDRNGSALRNLQFLADATRAIAYEVNRLDILGVDASGVALVSTIENLIGGKHVKTLGDIVYSSEGQAFDTILLAGVGVCELPPDISLSLRRGILEPSGVREEIYFYQSRLRELFTCDRDSFFVSSPVYVPNSFSTGSETLAMVEAGPNRLAIATETKMFLFDPTTLGND